MDLSKAVACTALLIIVLLAAGHALSPQESQAAAPTAGQTRQAQGS
jgi:hypothetical protein